MLKKAKANNWCDGKEYLIGKIYRAEEVAHLDPNDFEDVTDSPEIPAEEVKAEETVIKNDLDQALDETIDEIVTEEEKPGIFGGMFRGN